MPKPTLNNLPCQPPQVTPGASTTTHQVVVAVPLVAAVSAAVEDVVSATQRAAVSPAPRGVASAAMLHVASVAPVAQLSALEGTGSRQRAFRAKRYECKHPPDLAKKRFRPQDTTKWFQGPDRATADATAAQGEGGAAMMQGPASTPTTAMPAPVLSTATTGNNRQSGRQPHPGPD